MKRLFIFFIFCTFIYANEIKQVLLLHSYFKGRTWSDNVSKGIESVLLKENNIGLRTEYLGGYGNEMLQNQNLIYEHFYKKFKNRKFDAVIASDNFAVEFVLNYHDKLFKNIPIVLCGLYEENPGVDVQKAKKAKMHLVYENRKVKENIKLIKSIYPTIKHIYLITGTSETARLVTEKTVEIIKELDENIKITLNNEGIIEKVEKDYKSLDENSVVFFVAWVRDDNLPYNKLSNMLKNSPVPVFALSDTFLNHGLTGGIITLGKQNGIEAANIVLNAFNKKPLNYKEPVFPPTKTIFDDENLKKYNISTARLPKDSIIINQPKTFFEKHREFVDKVFMITPFILVSLIIALMNIFQRHKMAKKLVAQDYLQQVLLNNLQSSVFWIDTNGIVKGCNEVFASLVGRRQNEIIGQKICDIFELLCHLPLREKLFNLQDIEFELNKQNFLLRSKIFMDENKNNGGIVTVITEITEKKQLEINKQFIIQQSKLSEIGEMLSAIVHQWKNPLLDLSVVAHKIRKYYKKGKLDETQVESFFQTIMKQIIYMGDTIDHFRSFIKPSNKPVKFDVDKGLIEIQKILETSLGYNNIELIYTNSLKNDHILYGYPNEFKQVVLNIINNAKDAIIEARKKQKKAGRIKVDLFEDETYILISISDDGGGIKEEVLPTIFEPFFTTKDKGDGFGLYMAKLIIENKMQGKVEAQNMDLGANILIKLLKAKEV